MMTGAGASGVRGRVPCRETMGVSAVVRMLTSIDVFVLTGSVGSAGLRFLECSLAGVCMFSGLLHGVGAHTGGRYLGFWGLSGFHQPRPAMVYLRTRWDSFVKKVRLCFSNPYHTLLINSMWTASPL